MDEQKKEKVFAEGIFFQPISPEVKEKAPWLKGKLSFNVNEFTAFLKKHVNEKGFVNIDMKLSQKTNKIYLELNSWKPKPTLSPEDSAEIKAFREAQQKEVLNYPTEDLTPGF